jgi:hypothetical protein
MTIKHAHRIEDPNASTPPPRLELADAQTRFLARWR